MSPNVQSKTGVGEAMELEVLSFSKRSASKLSFEDGVPKLELGNETKLVIQ